MSSLIAFRRSARRLVALGAIALVAASPAPAPQLGYGPPPPSSPYGDGAEASDEAGRAARGPARVRSRVQPYLEYNQVLSADLGGDGDVLTYSVVAAGVDGRIQTRRVTAQMSYRYERRIAWNGDLPDNDAHSGVAQIGAEVVPGLLNFEAGAMAARTAGEGRAVGTTARDPAVEIYSLYAGPSLSTRAGPVAVTASYRLGYAYVDDDTLAGGPPRERYGSSLAHNASASVGMGPGRLPFGWTVGGGWVREEAGDLDHRFDGKYVRGDLVVPVGPTLALTAGVGYEDILATQRGILRDAAGVPILTPDGRIQPDVGAPRLVAYEQSGLIYDAGFIWRPDARTELQARAGRRYGGTTVIGSLRHQFNGRWGMRADVYDGVQTFGRLITSDLSDLPEDFDSVSNPLGGAGACLFGRDPGTGRCFARALQSVTTGSFRGRGANFLLSGRSGVWDLGLGAGYHHRRYHRPVAAGATLAESDRGFILQASGGRRLSRTSELNLDAYASWFDSSLFGLDEVFSTGVNASYRRSFLVERLQFLAALGVNHSSDGNADSTVATGLVGLRYTF